MPGTTFDVEAIAAADGKVIAHGDGVFVYVKGDDADCAYIVKSGSVEIREAGQTLETIGPGEIFGEMSLIDGVARTSSAVAIGRTEIFAIDRGLFDALVRDDHDFALAVMRLMSRRLRSAIAMMKPLEELPIAERQRRPA